MNADFHYYATYCAAILAGFSHEESICISYSDNFVDSCTRTLLARIDAPSAAATTQMSLEMMSARTDVVGIHDITRIWSSFHFLPKDLYAMPEAHGSRKHHFSKAYLNKYRLICGPDSELVELTVDLAKDKSLQAIGLAMHVLSDTWAHMNFAGTPSVVINDIKDSYLYLVTDEGDIKPNFRHSASAPDDIDNLIFTRSLGGISENFIMSLGHGRAGHLPDYCFLRYRYLPAWGDYMEILKDNPSDYKHAFCQMITALKYLHGDSDNFTRGIYDFDAIKDIEDEIETILRKVQPDASEDWRKLGEKLSGCEIKPYDVEEYLSEYVEADEDKKDDTFIGKFIIAALAQKSMVTAQIYKSGNKLAGRSVDYSDKGFGGMKDFEKLIREDKS